MSKVVAIVGMHRSGTSLLARYLHACGLSMGDDLLGLHASNPAGHYEDRDFLGWHNTLLEAHGLDHCVTAPVDWKIDDRMQAQAEAMISYRNAQYIQWGWKDPRTALFLPFWKHMIPVCHFVIVYRDPLQVVHSLLARDILMYTEKTNRWQRLHNNEYTQNAIHEKADRYLRMWIWYYQEIRNHLLDDSSISRICISFEETTQGNFHKLNTLRSAGFVLNPPSDFAPSVSRVRHRENIRVTYTREVLAEAEALDRVIRQWFYGAPAGTSE